MTKATAPKLTAAQRLAAVPTYLHVADIQGLAQLATQGVLGVTGLAESVQGNVYKAVAASFGPLGKRFTDRSPGSSGIKPFGVTGMVYGGIRGITRLAGGSVNAVLARAVPRIPVQKSSPQREAVLAAINGVLGDQLRATANPLMVNMAFRHQGQPLQLEKAALALEFPNATGKLLVVLHGLCMNDLQWTSTGKDGVTFNHADLLAKELGYIPIYLHYNTGLNTSINGQQFAGLLEQLLQAWPQPVEELTLLVHSMGGLVSRSACKIAEAGVEQAGMAWRKQLKNIVFLGTPHHGAPLERVGNWIDTTLGGNRVTKPFAAIGQIRSSGITDLRYGHVLESSWLGKDRFERSPDSRELLPLPTGVSCFAVAAVTSLEASARKNVLTGDGLVPLRSALGEHDEARHCLGFPLEQQWSDYGTHHMDLLERPEVTAQVLGWLRR